MKIRCLALPAAICLLMPHVEAADSSDVAQVVVLGTGTPVPDPLRAGAGVAVIHKGEAYLFDAGDGVVSRAIRAHLELGMDELDPPNIRHVFFTHLHSDHIHDYSVLASKVWWRRNGRLHAWGPKGLEALTDAMNEMMKVEADLRSRGTPADVIGDPEGYRVEADEISEGVVFTRDDLTIEAFAVPHGGIKPAFGYKITTDNKTIVISGDTRYSDVLVEKARNADILIHEVISKKSLANLPKSWQEYHQDSHTTTGKLAEVARKSRPGVLVLYHILFFGATAEEVLEEVTAGYNGEVVLATDLQVF